jgi:DNA-binding protein HU-beta
VKLPGFGTFQVSDRAASEGRHPRTGEKITIPASKQPKFKAGAELKRTVGINS